MSYVKTVWQDLPDRTTPITAARLNKLETQYDEVAADIGDGATPVGAALNSTYAAQTGYDARRAGVVADGTTDDRAALVSAFETAASFGAPVVLPAGRIKIAGSNIPVTSGGVRGAGRTATTIVGFGFVLSTGTFVENLGFDGTDVSAWAIDTISTSLVTGVRVERCLFKNYGTLGAVRLRASSGGGGATQCVVAGNDFKDNAYAVFIERALECLVTGNTSSNAAGVGRHIVFNSARGCQFTNNVVSGGILGISGVTNLAVGGTSPIRENVISGNIIDAVSEEGISLDLMGNSSTGVGAVDYGTIDAKSENTSINQLTLTLDSAFAGAPDNKFYNYWIVVTSGTSAGAVFQVAASNGLTFTANNVETSIRAGIAVGDTVAIGIPMFGNVISGNRVRNAGKWSILLWGLCVGNVVTQNTCATTLTTTVSDTGRPSGGVEVWGLDGLVVSTANYTGRLGRAPSLRNRVFLNCLNRTPVYEGVKIYSGASGFTSITNDLTENVTIQ